MHIRHNRHSSKMLPKYSSHAYISQLARAPASEDPGLSSSGKGHLWATEIMATAYGELKRRLGGLFLRMDFRETGSNRVLEHVQSRRLTSPQVTLAFPKQFAG